MVIEITDLNYPGVEVFSTLTEAQLRNRLNESEGIIIVESPKVIFTALDAGFEPVSMLTEHKHIIGDALPIISRIGESVPVYTGSRELLKALTGYALTRGVLCAMRRPQLPPPEEILKDASRVAVIMGVTDTTNIGSIFRSAAALGVDAVLLSPDSCDPFNRRSIRVSMGSVFLVPWAWISDPAVTLREYGFKTVALALTDRSVCIDDAVMNKEPKLAMLLGTEGDGLPADIIECCDYTARIPMAHGVDSLNVGAAAAVAFWQLRK